MGLETGAGHYHFVRRYLVVDSERVRRNSSRYRVVVNLFLFHRQYIRWVISCSWW
jgi:hypothetical protein